MLATHTRRPRNVDWKRAAAILYGDWGTSKAYVIGLAFAVAGYSSFWLIAAMCVLTALVGVNYIAICRCYPDGGGVYASVRHRSEVISIVGAFLLIADYLVTAAISALSAFQYLHVPHPEAFAAGAILVVGALNLLGPKHTGGLAVLVSLPTVAVVVVLGLFALPHLGSASRAIVPLHGGILPNWNAFVGIVLALSGVEAIANATGVMKLNPGSTPDRPCVSRTAKPALLWVMLEVCLFTALFGLAIHALPGLQVNHGDVDAPGQAGVRDSMLNYMAQVFVGHALGPAAGQVAGWVVSLVFGALLLSAVNTAVVDLIAIGYLMSRDGELPPQFQKLNSFGVPALACVLVTLVPVSLVLGVRDMAGLADLYAVGVVGAIATNLGASSTDRKLALRTWERVLMFGTFLVMVAIEISLLADKPSARVFVVTILAVGLVLRGLASEHSARKRKAVAAESHPTPPLPPGGSVTGSPIACAVRGVGRTLDFAVEEARATGRPLYLIYVREQSVITPEDAARPWTDDPEAARIFSHAAEIARGHPVLPCYAVTDSAPETIADLAATVGASRLILGAPQRGALVSLLRGDVVRSISALLPEDISLLIYA